MFDRVRCLFPLPHHQDADFQTKDLAFLTEGESIGGFLDDYEITADGRLRRHAHAREWRDDPDAVLGGHFASVRDWWEDLPDVHGDIRIYTSEGTPGEPDHRWVEFRIRFTNGRVEHIRDTSG